MDSMHSLTVYTMEIDKMQEKLQIWPCHCSIKLMLYAYWCLQNTPLLEYTKIQ